MVVLNVRASHTMRERMALDTGTSSFIGFWQWKGLPGWLGEAVPQLRIPCSVVVQFHIRHAGPCDAARPPAAPSRQAAASCTLRRQHLSSVPCSWPEWRLQRLALALAMPLPQSILTIFAKGQKAELCTACVVRV